MSHEIKNINDLPSIQEMKRRSQGLALMDAVLCPEWDSRYFSFNCNWDGNGDEMMASMRDGSGSEYFIHFSSQGVAGKVLFADETLGDSSISLGQVPDKFSAFKNEVAFSLRNATFFFWRGSEDDFWSSSPGNLSSYPLLGFLVDSSCVYHEWAEEYYEVDIDAGIVDEVFSTLAVDEGKLSSLNAEIKAADLQNDLLEIFGIE